MKRVSRRKGGGIRLGVHTSISGGISKSVERAALLGCGTMQIFSHSPRQWRQSVIPDDEVRRFRSLRKKHNIAPVYIHASYLINLASLSEATLAKSVELLSYELDNADTLGAEYLVLHTGSAGTDAPSRARKRAVRAIRKAVRSKRFCVSILLENTAGERGDITSSMRTLADLSVACEDSNVGGICIDTCHAFASGYDLTSRDGVNQMISEVDSFVGIEKLRLLHLNDSRKPLASGVDRHEHIGRGYIGAKGFRNILADRRLKGIPMILETPKEREYDDEKNLRKVISMMRSR